MLAGTFDWIRDRAKADPARAKVWYERFATPFAGNQLDFTRRTFRIELAAIVGFEANCVEAMAAIEPHFPADAPLLRERIRCYEATQHPLLDNARADLNALMDGWHIQFDSNLP
jgi:hypothetical protein